MVGDRSTLPALRVQDIVEAYKKSYYDDEIKRGFNRRVSGRLDNLGFKELRDKDESGSFFDIPKDVFEIIVSPICPNLSSESSESSGDSKHDNDNDNKKTDEGMTKTDEASKENKEKKKRGSPHDNSYGTKKHKARPSMTILTHNDDNDDIYKPGTEKKLQKWKKNRPKGAVHVDWLKDFCGFTEKEIEKLHSEGMIQETSPGRFKLV